LFGKGRLVIDFRDPWVGNPYIKKARFLKTLDRLVERFVVKKADLIVANTEQLKEEMLERYPDRIDSMMVLPNSFDPMNFIDLPKLSLNRNKLIIAHAGFLYLGRDPIDILNALSDLIKNKIDIAQQIEFHQIGKIQLEYDLNEKTTEMMIEKQVVNAGQMDHRQCLGYLSMADVLILIQPNTNTQIPSKLYEYIYLEKPIISVTNKDGALGRMILNNKLGMVFEPGDHKGLSTCLTHMVHAKKAGNQILAEYGKTKDKFDARYVTRQLSERLTSVA
jgi:glycosyltransferase involved in cell wall biosynthesis